MIEIFGCKLWRIVLKFIEGVSLSIKFRWFFVDIKYFVYLIFMFYVGFLIRYDIFSIFKDCLKDIKFKFFNIIK